MRKGVTWSSKLFLFFEQHKILLNDCSIMNFKVVRTDILEPNYGHLKYTKINVQKFNYSIYCEIYLNARKLPLLSNPIAYLPTALQMHDIWYLLYTLTRGVSPSLTPLADYSLLLHCWNVWARGWCPNRVRLWEEWGMVWGSSHNFQFVVY